MRMAMVLLAVLASFAVLFLVAMMAAAATPTHIVVLVLACVFLAFALWVYARIKRLFRKS